MHTPYQQVQLDKLMARTGGNPQIRVGIIDGPIWYQAPQFAGQTFYATHQPTLIPDGIAAYQHGTVITGLLAGGRDSTIPGICPDCTFFVESIFCTPEDSCLVSQPKTLADAIRRMVDKAKVHVINLSVGVSQQHMTNQDEVQQAINHAQQQGTLIIVAAGNQGHIGSLPLSNHRWLIPVVACDALGRRYAAANLGPAIGRQGLMAPGVQVGGLTTDGQAATFTGTSFATPFVTGTAALLWSLYPHADTVQIRRTLLGHAPRRSIIPPLLQADQSLSTT
jgi:subtilisin family serine protease